MEEAMSSMRLVQVVVICAAVGVAPSSAQTERAVATLTHAQGAVYLDDQLVVASSGVIVGDSAFIRTVGGRAVVALKRGGVIALNEHTLVRVLANAGYNFNRIEVVEGTAVVISGTSTPLVTCRSDAQLSSAGVFRFDVQPTRTGDLATCRFRVYDGAAAVPLASVISPLRSGQTMTLDPTCGDHIPTVPFVPDQMDDFDRWSRQQAIVSLR
jgi:hypothetical protein